MITTWLEFIPDFLFFNPQLIKTKTYDTQKFIVKEFYKRLDLMFILRFFSSKNQ